VEAQESMPEKKQTKLQPLIDKELMEILACPMCKSDLKLVDLRGKKKEKNEEKLDGKLICTNKNCRQVYPIEDGIPILLPPDLREK